MNFHKQAYHIPIGTAVHTTPYVRPVYDAQSKGGAALLDCAWCARDCIGRWSDGVVHESDDASANHQSLSVATLPRVGLTNQITR
jgi:hypothetical protein